MVSESEILTSFLLERAQIKDALPKERFRKMFPKGTPEDVIKDVRHIVAKKLESRLDTVNAAIQERGESFGPPSLEVDPQEKKRRNASKATKNLDKISTLLDEELDALEREYQEALGSLKSTVSDLNDIAYPAKKDASSLDTETAEELVESIKKFKSLREK